MKSFFTAIFIVFFFNTKAFAHSTNKVILFIGDGMGLSQITYEILKDQQNSNFHKFQNIGLTKTFSASEEVTDSAAAATAMATGKKTFNGAIGIDFNKNPQPTIIELAKKQGFSSGIIVTSPLIHATPAAFYAHQASRHSTERIALDFVNSDIDIAIAGGLKSFKNQHGNLDLTKNLIKRNYKIYENAEEFFRDNYEGKILALLEKYDLPMASERNKNYSIKSLNKALRILNKNKKGFFLLFEGSQIDYAGHDNDPKYLLDEMRDFNKAIGVALEFAKNNKDTLVIVTGDHETGGLALVGRNYKDDNYGNCTPQFMSKGHSATMIPVFAFGKGAEEFQGVYDNTEIFYKIKKLMGI